MTEEATNENPWPLDTRTMGVISRAAFEVDELSDDPLHFHFIGSTGVWVSENYQKEYYSSYETSIFLKKKEKQGIEGFSPFGSFSKRSSAINLRLNDLPSKIYRWCNS